MDERRRFATALAGVAGLLAIAGGIATTGPRRPETLPVAPAADTRPVAAPLRALPLPAWSQATPAARAQRGRVSPVSSARAVIAPPPSRLAAGELESPSIGPAETGQPLLLAVSPRVVPMRQPPAAVAASVSETRPASRTSPATRPDPVRRHGPVSGALVTAGQEVGAGFRTVGRTLKRLF